MYGTKINMVAVL